MSMHVPRPPLLDTGTHPRPPARAEIVLISGRPSIVRQVRLTFDEQKICNRPRVFARGEAALAQLREGARARRVRPDLALVDLHLDTGPLDRLLPQLAADEVLRHLPVAGLTTTRAEAEFVRASGMCAAGVLLLPFRLTDLAAIIASTGNLSISIICTSSSVQDTHPGQAGAV